MKTKQLILECNCGHGLLKLLKDSDSTNFAFYSHSSVSFLARLKNAWKYLIGKGNLLLEDIELSEEELGRLGEFAATNSKSETSKSGYKGIYIRNDRKNKYYVEVAMPTNSEGEQHTHYVGSFATLEEAVEARKNYITELL